VTQDGGKPGVLQHFVGPQCGGDGWVLFRQDASTGSWTETVAHLSNTNDGSCPASLGRAYTRWRIEDITWTLYFGRQPERVTLPTIDPPDASSWALADCRTWTAIAGGAVSASDQHVDHRHQ
jgi:hypothetical protein